jgi:glycosyltransferase involved in cell wall biosynthesis
MASKILELAEQPQIRMEMGKAGRVRIQKEFTWEKERDSLRALLNI